MFSFLSLCFIMLLLFSNSMFYTVFLLFLVVYMTVSLYSMSLVSTLTSLILVLVYVGAMMILVGYICAVSPNLITSSSFNSSFLLVFLVAVVVFSDSFPNQINSQFHPFNEFYTGQLNLFVLIVFMLFITLLMVTSQQSTPRGPFRSL